MQRDGKNNSGRTSGGRLLGGALASFAVLGLSACNPHPLKATGTNYSSASSSSIALEVDKQLDVLFIVDNSGSMAEEQAKLAANFAPFIETLDAAGADYRIAVTTSDDGGFSCIGAPEQGRFVATSCLDRPQDFGNDELFEATCAAHCSYTTQELGIEATAAVAGGELAPRPWIQSRAGEANLAEGITALEAFQCLAPQGVTGCGYERQLESMSRALSRSDVEGDAQFGFLRPGANLLVVVVTDEADCSYDERYENVLFDPGYGGQFFAPDYGLPTSAVCWNAGVRCEGSPDGYDDCESVELDIHGDPTEVAGESMLHPVADYVDLLAELAKDREVMVSVIAGVGQDYGLGKQIAYRDAQDPQVARNFGVDYGCTSGEGEDLQWAVPPVRLAEFAGAFAKDHQNLFSVCADDYTPALEEIVDTVLAEFGPGCFEGCLADTDAQLEGVQASCDIFEIDPVDGEERSLDPCVLEGEAFVLPEGVDACWILRDDASERTQSTADDLAPECRVEGQNAQFELLRRADVVVVPGTEVRAECELSAFPSVVCPGT